jgi:hypothetical protein
MMTKEAVVSIPLAGERKNDDREGAVNLGDVPYLAQETAIFCGPASAAMALGALGKTGLAQADLFDHQCHDLASVWSTTPDGLAETLAMHAGGTPAAGFYRWQMTPDEPTASRLICWTIFAQQRPVIVLVGGDAHWLVVTGYELEPGSVDPVSASDSSYKIAGFYVNDPFSGEFPPEPHLRFEYVPYAVWKRDKLNHTVWDRPDPTNHAFKDHFVVIAGPDEPSVNRTPANDEIAPTPEPEIRGLRGPDEARRDAVVGLDQPFLLESDVWRASREGTEPGRPLPIERLDEPGGLFHLVPFQRAVREDARVTPLTVLVNAATGAFEGAAATPDQSGYLSEMLDPERMLARFIEGVTDPETGQLILLDRTELHPTLVWRMCRESSSPYWPFYRFDVEGAPIFIRLDGETFFTLHDALGD